MSFRSPRLSGGAAIASPPNRIACTTDAFLSREPTRGCSTDLEYGVSDRKLSPDAMRELLRILREQADEVRRAAGVQQGVILNQRTALSQLTVTFSAVLSTMGSLLHSHSSAVADLWLGSCLAVVGTGRGSDPPPAARPSASPALLRSPPRSRSPPSTGRAGLPPPRPPSQAPTGGSAEREGTRQIADKERKDGPEPLVTGLSSRESLLRSAGASNDAVEEILRRYGSSGRQRDEHRDPTRTDPAILSPNPWGVTPGIPRPVSAPSPSSKRVSAAGLPPLPSSTTSTPTSKGGSRTGLSSSMILSPRLDETTGSRLREGRGDSESPPRHSPPPATPRHAAVSRGLPPEPPEVTTPPPPPRTSATYHEPMDFSQLDRVNPFLPSSRAPGSPPSSRSVVSHSSEKGTRPQDAPARRTLNADTTAGLDSHHRDLAGSYTSRRQFTAVSDQPVQASPPRGAQPDVTDVLAQIQNMEQQLSGLKASLAGRARSPEEGRGIQTSVPRRRVEPFWRGIASCPVK